MLKQYRPFRIIWGDFYFLTNGFGDALLQAFLQLNISVLRPLLQRLVAGSALQFKSAFHRRR